MIGRVNTGGGSGCILTITAVANETVTISKNGKSKSKTTDSKGVAVFRGLDNHHCQRRCSDYKSCDCYCGLQRCNSAVCSNHQHHISCWFDLYLYGWYHNPYSP